MRYYTIGHNFTTEEVRNLLVYIHSIIHRYVESLVEPNGTTKTPTYRLRVELSPKEWSLLFEQGITK